MEINFKELLSKKKVILAPMAGITSFSYRKFMNKFDPALTYTEMISDCGLIYGNKKTFEMLQTDGSDRPLGIQLFGGKKETILNAIDILENLPIEYDVLDINLACPVNKVVKSNGGSTWLKDQDALFDLMSEVVKKSKKPVSAKIRLGYNEINVNETVQTLERAGVQFIMIHARTRKDLYHGKARYEELIKVRDLIKIPFGISGDIYTPLDAINALKITRANAVLVARGGVGNPLLISNINHLLNNEELEETNFNKQFEYFKEYKSLLVKEKGEKIATSILKGIAPKFFLNLKEDSKELRKRLVAAQDISDFDKIIEEFINESNLSKIN